jgi:nitroimidazol reductase NimA-like FMN-containing flavoprotein (pyridoxamine 5'-phosphate oxidase superfamily)
MDEKNLDIYGDPPMPWSRPLSQLNAFVAGPHNGMWLATTNPDGRPHVNGIGAVWLDDRFYFTSRLDTRKSRNLASNPACSIALELPDIDLVVDGTAAVVDDEATLERLAALFREQGWPATVKDGAITAEYSAPSAGPPPWHLYVVTPNTTYGVATEEPYGAMRWRFSA